MDPYNAVTPMSAGLMGGAGFPHPAYGGYPGYAGAGLGSLGASLPTLIHSIASEVAHEVARHYDYYGRGPPGPGPGPYPHYPRYRQSGLDAASQAAPPGGMPMMQDPVTPLVSHATVAQPALLSVEEQERNHIEFKDEVVEEDPFKSERDYIEFKPINEEISFISEESRANSSHRLSSKN
mmetsp:Transcript_7695/g.11655  ORF Transcript_7695/g.11655 Transcript_7695/m.11655 type:complete len:180 (-) Transcript_7695:167-706(-)